MLSQVRPAIVSTLVFTLLLGVVYPLAITGISKVAFPFQAEGSLLKDRSGKVIGSALIGQAHVNVLKTNLDLDGKLSKAQPGAR